MTKLLTLDDLARAILVHNTDGLTFEREPEIVQTALRGTARAILTTIKEAGYAIVPVEADEKMIIRGIVERHGSDVPEAWSLATKNIWQAMQSAAPQIEGE